MNLYSGWRMLMLHLHVAFWENVGMSIPTSLTEADIIFTSSVHCLAMRVTTDYISVGCNRGTSTSDVNADGIVAFGAGKLVALWNSAVRTGCSLETLAVEAPCTDGAWMFFSRIPRIEECIPHFQGIHTTSPKSDIYLSPHPHLHHHLQSSRVTNLAMSEYGYRVMRFRRYWVHRTGSLLQLKLILCLYRLLEFFRRRLKITVGNYSSLEVLMDWSRSGMWKRKWNYYRRLILMGNYHWRL
jgi:hypothetical protein